jgi:hypothetical protein
VISYLGRTILDVIFGKTLIKTLILHFDLTTLENLVTVADFYFPISVYGRK